MENGIPDLVENNLSSYPPQNKRETATTREGNSSGGSKLCSHWAISLVLCVEWEEGGGGVTLFLAKVKEQPD